MLGCGSGGDIGNDGDCVDHVDISYQGSGLKQVNYSRDLMSLTIF